MARRTGPGLTALVPVSVRQGQRGDPPTERTRHGGTHHAWGVVVGLLGILVAVAIPFAPVIGQATVVQWPQAGGPVRPSTAFFVPYRPAELHVTVPCRALRAALAAPGRTTVLATTARPAGLLIEASGGRLLVAADGWRVPVALSPAGCDLRFDDLRFDDLRFDADGAGTTVSVAGAQVLRRPGARVPEVFAFDTDLDAGVAAGMGVTARTPYWFASTPTGWKYGLLATQGVLVVVALGLLARHGGSSVPVPAPGPPRRRSRAGLDAVVLLVLAGWGVIGPLTDDDGFAAMIARNTGADGDPGNYYRWFNASEAPFTLALHLVRAFAEVSVAPLWLRVPSLLAGALTWLVLHRWVLPPTVARTPWTGPLAAACLLAWWLPYGLGTRPEPFVALGVTLVLALTLAATARAVRRPLAALGLAVLVAAATAATAPTGVLAAVPVLLCAPAGWRLLREGAPRGGVVARVALLGAVAASVITIMFADQSWHGAVVATGIHRHIGPDLAWSDEVQRYLFLLGTDSWGSAGKRLPVLLTLALPAPLLALFARHGRSLLERPAQLVALGGAPCGLLLLALTPSKWTHHFGALAGLGGAFLVAAITVGATAARRHRGDRVTVAIGLGGGVLVAFAVGLSFTGPNAWWAYSDFGLPFSDGPIRPLDSPLLWSAVPGAAAAVAALWRLGSRRVAAVPARGAAVVAAPALLAALAAATSVALLLATFVAASLRRAGGYSLAAQNAADLTGAGCGIEDHVQVLRDLPDGAPRLAGALPPPPADQEPAVAGSGGEPATATGLRRVSAVGLQDFLDRSAPVLVEWPIAFVLPCRQDVPVVAGGLAEAPAAVLAVPVRPRALSEPWTNDSARLVYALAEGAAFAGVRLIGRAHPVRTRLVGDEGRDWGRVEFIGYGMPTTPARCAAGYLAGPATPPTASTEILPGSSSSCSDP